MFNNTFTLNPDRHAAEKNWHGIAMGRIGRPMA
jgi:hypothetical protein